jgi:hypothetical protein
MCTAWAAFWFGVDRLSRRRRPGSRPDVGVFEPPSIGDQAEAWLHAQRVEDR